MKGNRKMQARTIAATLIALLLLASCEGDRRYVSPAGPDGPPPPPPVAPAPLPTQWPPVPADNIAGPWVGTVEQVGGDFGELTCKGPATATFTQHGSAISGTLSEPPDCWSDYQYSFQSTHDGHTLKGEIPFPGFSWPVEATLRGDTLFIGVFNVYGLELAVWNLHRED